jgi:hypothetical protein
MRDRPTWAHSTRLRSRGVCCACCVTSIARGSRGGRRNGGRRRGRRHGIALTAHAPRLASRARWRPCVYVGIETGGIDARARRRLMRNDMRRQHPAVDQDRLSACRQLPRQSRALCWMERGGLPLQLPSDHPCPAPPRRSCRDLHCGGIGRLRTCLTCAAHAQSHTPPLSGAKGSHFSGIHTRHTRRAAHVETFAAPNGGRGDGCACPIKNPRPRVPRIVRHYPPTRQDRGGGGGVRHWGSRMSDTSPGGELASIATGKPRRRRRRERSHRVTRIATVALLPHVAPAAAKITSAKKTLSQSTSHMLISSRHCSGGT